MDNWQLSMLIYLLLINALTLVVFGWDKRLARHGLNRISENTLWCLCILGGALGGWAGMYLFRHKTRHLPFRWGIPALFIAQAALFIYWWP